MGLNSCVTQDGNSLPSPTRTERLKDAEVKVKAQRETHPVAVKNVSSAFKLETATAAMQVVGTVTTMSLLDLDSLPRIAAAAMVATAVLRATGQTLTTK